MHARLKNEFTEDEKCHNLISRLISFHNVLSFQTNRSRQTTYTRISFHNVLSFQTNRSRQTTYTRIRLEHSDQGLHCLPLLLHLLDALIYSISTPIKFINLNFDYYHEFFQVSRFFSSLQYTCICHIKL